jgi:hypothetical protein
MTTLRNFAPEVSYGADMFSISSSRSVIMSSSAQRRCETYQRRVLRHFSPPCVCSLGFASRAEAAEQADQVLLGHKDIDVTAAV